MELNNGNTKKVIVRETFEIYSEKIINYDYSKNSVFYDYIDGKKNNNILYKDDKFILIETTENSSDRTFSCIVTDKALSSLRDLRRDDISLLNYIRFESCKNIKDKYNIETDELLFYINYPVQTMHLVVHICMKKCSIDDFIFKERFNNSHDLADIMNNLYNDSMFYTKNVYYTLEDSK